MKYQQTLRKWGNGQGFRVPKKVLEAGNYKIGQEFEFKIENGRLIGTPKPTVSTKKFDQIVQDTAYFRTDQHYSREEMNER